MKPSKFLYNITRKTSKLATFFNDIETLLTFDPKKIAKRAARKATYKTSGKIAKKISDKFK